jgi:hypothetical protein
MHSIKKTSLFLLLILISFSLSAKNHSQLKFAEKKHNFGNIYTPVAIHKFKFTNISKKPLVLMRVEATCGCTAVDYSRGIIYPSKEGFIAVRYNAAGYPKGFFRKAVNFCTEKEIGRLIIEGTAN